MIHLLIIFIIPMLLYSFIPYTRITISQINKDKLKKRCYNPMLRKDICFHNTADKCPMSSYKQCTNNGYTVNRCNCFERSYELCDKTQQFSQKCYLDTLNNKPDINITISSNQGDRVNMYRTKSKTIKPISTC